MAEVPIFIIICLGVGIFLIGALVGGLMERKDVKKKITKAIDLSKIPIGGGKIVHLTAKVQFRGGKMIYFSNHGFTALSNPEYLDCDNAVHQKPNIVR